MASRRPPFTLSQHQVAFPEALHPLFQPARYKVICGGRGKGASWGIARALLLEGADRPLRILCAREVQRSIKESVYELLRQQIKLLKMDHLYTALATEIRGRNGTQFIFSGLKEHTVASIKSYEGIDRCWIAEAQAVSERSWDFLIPTIRKPGSEIWMDLNPELDTDPAYRRFILSPPPDAIVIRMTYRDNPWFPAVLEQERQHALKTMSREDYENIWEGKPRTTVVGAIYATEVQALLAEGRYTLCPYDPRLKVHTIWDLGWNDATAILLVQRQLSECRIIAYYEGRYKRVDEWAAELNRLPYNWGWDYLPPDGYAQGRQTGQSDAELLRKCGRRVRPRHQSIPAVDVETGIRALRVLLPRVYLHKDGPGMARLLQCLQRYRRTIPRTTGEPAAPLHDEYSHGADALRYLALVVERLRNEEDRAPVLTGVAPRPDPVCGWLGGGL